MTKITIDKRFCGPRHSANGGYACGRLGKLIDGPARARLNMPPPLEAALDLRNEKGRIVAYYGAEPAAWAEPAEVFIDLPPVPEADAISKAHNAYLAKADSHYLPYCFVCGPRRNAGDGLRIFAGEIEKSPVNADYWMPTDDLAGKDGLVAEEFLWAALDCPTVFALRYEDGFCLLGSLAVEVKRRPKPRERLIAIAWAKGADGRKHYADSALVDANGEAIAAANAVWIELNDPALLEQLKAENA